MQIKTINLLSALIICMFICILFGVHSVQASPAYPGEVTLTQPDGTTKFMAHQWGDEWSHDYDTAEGYSILQMKDGWWVNAVPQPDGTLGSVQVDGRPARVGIDSPAGGCQQGQPRQYFLQSSDRIKPFLGYYNQYNLL